MTDLMEMVFGVVDTETTGFDHAKDKVVELAVVLVRPSQGILDRKSWLVNPGIAIPPEASAIHHLTNADLEGSPSIDHVLGLLDPIRNEFAAFAAHNAGFDFGFIPAGEKPVLCTRKIAMKLWPKLTHSSNQYLRYLLKLEVPEVAGLAAHRAEADALVTARLLAYLLARIIELKPELASVEALAKVSAEPILLYLCGFGKHRGTPWAEVPKDYLKWAIKNIADMEADQRFTIEHYLKA